MSDMQMPQDAKSSGAEEGPNGDAAAEVVVMKISGNVVYEGSAVLVSDLKESIAAASGLHIGAQRLMHGTEILDDSSQSLSALSESLNTSAPQHLYLTLVEAELCNVALASNGARVKDQAEPDKKPLLRHDDAFPGLDWVTLGEEPVPIPVEVLNGAAFAQHLVAQRPEWSDDCAISTFLDDSQSCVVVLPNNGARVARIGCTYTPWDRCPGDYGEISMLFDNEFVTIGTIETIAENSRGNPGDYSVASRWIDVPAHLSQDRCKAVRWSWDYPVWQDARRLHFVYALGYR